MLSCSHVRSGSRSRFLFYCACACRETTRNWDAEDSEVSVWVIVFWAPRPVNKAEVRISRYVHAFSFWLLSFSLFFPAYHDPQARREMSVQSKIQLASFPGPAHLSVAIYSTEATESWAGPGNEAKNQLCFCIKFCCYARYWSGFQWWHPHVELPSDVHCCVHMVTPPGTQNWEIQTLVFLLLLLLPSFPSLFPLLSIFHTQTSSTTQTMDKNRQQWRDRIGNFDMHFSIDSHSFLPGCLKFARS